MDENLNISEISTQLAEEKELLSSITEALSEFVKTYQNIKKSLQSVGDISAVDFGALDSKLATLKNDITNYDTTLTKSSDAMNEVFTELNSAKEKIIGVSKDIETLDKTSEVFKNFQAKIENLTESIEDAINQIKELKFDKYEESLQALIKTVEKQNEIVESIAKKNDERLATIEENLKTLLERKEVIKEVVVQTPVVESNVVEKEIRPVEYEIKEEAKAISRIIRDGETASEVERFWENHYVDREFLLMYAKSKLSPFGLLDMEEEFSKIKRIILISLFSFIIVFWAIMCNTALNDVASDILPLSLGIVGVCIWEICIFAKKEKLVVISNQKITPEEIVACVKEGKFPVTYNPREDKFIKFCLLFRRNNQDIEKLENIIKERDASKNKKEPPNKKNYSTLETKTKSESLIKKEENKTIIETKKTDSYAEIEKIVNDGLAGKIVINQVDERLRKIELPDIDFNQLNNMAKEACNLSNDLEMEVARNICMHLKRVGYLDSANKVYKYLLYKGGMNEFLMKDWMKIFVCNKQIETAIKMLNIGILAYECALPRANIPQENLMLFKVLGGFPPCECQMHLADIRKAIHDGTIDDYIIRVGGNPKRIVIYDLK